MRILSTLLVASSLALGGCTSLLGDFTYDANGSASGGSGGRRGSGGAAGEQGDIVVMPTTGLITTEQGAKATFSIVLRRLPAKNVAIALSSSNEKEGTVSPISVTFTPDNFQAPQLVQVTGVDDAVADSTQDYVINTSPASSEDPSYLGIDPVDPEVRNVDDETAGFLLMPPGGLVTNESGAEATFTLALTHAPSADVVIPLSSDNPLEGTVSPASLTFTSVNWMAPQVVTVTGVNDDAADGPQTYHVVTGAASSMDAGYNKLDPDNETVVNQDNDSAGVTLSPQTGLVTFENGAMTSFGIALNSPPSGDVSIALSSSNEAEGTVEPDHVTFTSLNWMAPQTVTVTGVDDTRADGNQPYFIRTAPCESADHGYGGLDGPDAEVTNIDDDSPGLVVTPTVGLVTSEDGGSTTFTVALQSKPRGGAQLDVASSRPLEGVATPATLTFTEANWNAPQTVTVTGVDDKMADGMQIYVVHVAPNAMSADPAYGTLNPTDVNLSNTDNDSAGITVVAGQGLTTSEAGGSATFTIALNSQPSDNVSVALTTSDATEGTVSPATLVFTRDNYNAPQTVTVKGVNDDMQDGNQPYHIVTEAAVSNDPGYSGLNATNVDLSNIDDDSAGITVSAPNQPLTTTEGGGTATFTVVLNSQPNAEVNIPVQSSNPAEGTVSVNNLKFTMDNWRAPQTVTVKGVEDDGTADGNQQYQVWLLLAVTGDDHYKINPPNVNVVNIDNDTPGITIKNATNLTTKEDGSMASFQIVLNSKPTANVSIALSSSKPAEGTVTPASVTFTGANWNAPQTVTVAGVDDKVADGNQTYRVITAAAVSPDPKYSGMDPADPQLTNVDNDSPGISVTFTPPTTTSLTTRETGASATFSISLNSQPTADVTIAVHSSNAAEGTVNPALLTFTAANWNAPHNVTVTGVDDTVHDGAQPYTVVIDPAKSSDAKYAGLDAPDVPATNVDNDSAGISVSPVTSPNNGNTKERGASASFTIALNSQPTADVTIALSSTDTTEGTVSPASVTFTAANYAAPQKITISPVDDQVADGTQPYSINIAPAMTNDRSGYAGLDADDVMLSNIDDDSAGITATIKSNVVTSSGQVATTEGGGTATLSISLNSQPTGDVTIPLSSSNPNEGVIAKSQVVFTAANYASIQTVSITGVDDAAADGDQLYSIVIGAATSADNGYDKMDVGDLAVTNIDDDSAGLSVVAPVDPTTMQRSTNEASNALPYTFTIALTSKPSGNVTVPLTSNNTAEGVVSPASLLFTTVNWKAPQTVTVTGVNDNVADGSQSYAIQIGAATSTDKGYSGFDYPTDIAMTNIDDDSPGFQFTTPGSTSEAGTTTTFSIVLSSQPTATVTIPLSSSDTTEGTVTPSSLIFTTDDWNSSNHIVTVHGEDDHIADGPQTFTIVTAAAVSADKGYSGLNPADVDIINTDNDVAGVSVTLVSPADGTTTEAGGVAKFAIVLNSQPKAAVSVPVVSNNTDEGVLDRATVDFTTSNWASPQTVTVTGVDDAIADGDQRYTVLVGKPTSTDAAYAAIDPDDVNLLNKDNDSAGIEVDTSQIVDISEDGTSTTFDVWLDSQPKATVTIPISVSNPDEATITPPTTTALVFTTTNWKTHQHVTITGVNDDVVDGPQDSTVVTGIAVSTDTNYDGRNPKDVAIRTLDNDSAAIIVTPPPPDMSSTGEAAAAPTVTFSVVLTSAPKGTVTIPLQSSLPSEGAISVPLSGQLVFNSSNWRAPQVVTVVGVDDPDPDGNRPYVILVGPSMSTDKAYDNKNLGEIDLTNIDDEPQ